MEKVPRVSVGVIVRKEEKILFLLRKGAHGTGTWSLPGGHLEFNEQLEESAKREVFEETGVRIKNVKFAGLTNDIFESEGKHYITIFMESVWEHGEPTITEPEKCSQVKWADLQDLPQPIFLPLKNFIEQGNLT